MEIGEDIYFTLDWNYSHYNDTEVRPLKDAGNFFPWISGNPSRYLYKIDPEFYQTLKSLREQGKFVFLLSNSHWPMVEMALNEIIGPDYMEIFDLIIIQGAKPGFWQKGRPYYNFNPDLPNMRDEWNGTFQGEKLVWGNVDELNQFFVQKFGDGYKVIYFGDSAYSDCGYKLSIDSNSHWDAAYIYEDLYEIEDPKIFSKEYFDYRSWWGSAFYGHPLQDQNTEPIETAYFHLAKNCFAKTFAMVHSPSCLNFLKMIKKLNC